MAKSTRGRAKKPTARQTTVAGKQKKALTPSASDIKTLVYGLPAKQLDELISAATARRNEELATAKASFLDEVRSRAASLGMTLADIVGLGGGKAAAKKGSAPGVKYRNPKTGDTWSGRGRPAKWLTDLEAQGHKREEFSV